MQNNSPELLIDISVDDEEYASQTDVSIIEICKFVGITIPRFCYHELLSVAGNCRMCLVEIENLDKPVAACVTEVADGMTIYVNSPFSKKARENVVELLLINHPLDCPICDQAGECDLQDQTKEFGAKLSRFFFNKKTVEDKYCGPLIKTIMTRCITCTRCIRFCDEIAGSGYLGALNRGEKTEIGAYVDKIFKSEISGNVIDLCPVGALNAKPIANENRPWELRILEGIDITDSLGANIYIEHKETSIARITPKANNEINRSLISDKARFYFDSFNRNRLLHIFSIGKNKLLKKATWTSFFNRFSKAFEDKKQLFKVIVDADSDLKTLLYLKHFTNLFQENFQLLTFNNKFSKNTSITEYNAVSNTEKETESIFFFGSNPKFESPVLNTKIRETFVNSASNIYAVGLTDFEYNSKKININANILTYFANGKHKDPSIGQTLSSNKDPLFIFGQNFADKIEDFCFAVSAKSNIFSSAKMTFVLLYSNLEAIRHLNISHFVREKSKKKERLIFSNISVKTILAKYTYSLRSFFSTSTHPTKFIIKNSDFIIPTKTPVESENILFNMEHRPQKFNPVSFFFINIYSTSHIFKALLGPKGTKTPWFKVFKECLYIKELLSFFELFSGLRNNIEEGSELRKKVVFFYYKFNTTVKTLPLFQKIKNFYQNSLITLNSEILERCTKEKKLYFENHLNANA